MHLGLLLAALLLGAPDSIPGAATRLPPPLSTVALERRLAARLGARVGDTLTIGLESGTPARRVVVAAIYEPARDPSAITKREYNLRLHLPELAALLGAPDRVDRFGIGLQPGVRTEAAAAELNRVAFGYRAYPSAEIASQSSQTFRVVSRFHEAIAVISVVASAIFLLCIMLLKVEERRLDAAVMRFIGIRRAHDLLARSSSRRCLVAAVGSGLGAGARRRGRVPSPTLLPAVLRHHA